MHSSRMCTTHFETLCASVSVTTTICHSCGSLMNKFKQVSSDHHQMSLAGGSSGLMPWRGSPGLMSRGSPGLMSRRGSPDLMSRERGTLPCDLCHHMTYPMIHLMLHTYLLPVNRQTPVRVLPSC